MNKLTLWFKYAFLSVASIISLFPFLWMVLGATNTSNNVVKGRLMVGNQLIANARAALIGTNFGRSIVNSLLVVAVLSVLSLFFCSLAGYAFEMYQDKKKDIAMGLILASMMLPFVGMMIPLYTLFGRLNLLDNFWAIILPGISSAFLIFFFRQNTRSFPRELIQAARIDGLSELGIFLRIYFPTMKSTYAAAAIITFMGAWNNYMWPLIVLQSPDKQTLPLVISAMGASSVPDYGMLMFALVIATVPTAVLFFGLQKFFVEGMVGSVKG